jgi:hypothetical protein
MDQRSEAKAQREWTGKALGKSFENPETFCCIIPKFEMNRKLSFFAIHRKTKNKIDF